MAHFKPFRNRTPSESRGGLVVESHVRPNLVVVHAPGLHDSLNLGQGGESVDVEAFITQRSVERFNVAIVGILQMLNY
jgi:hypothetical protein